MQQSVWGQAQLAFREGNRGPAWLSVPWGAAIPLATHLNAHAVDAAQPLTGQPFAYLAAGGLVYSGLTVYDWMRGTLLVGCETRWARLGAGAKALGFVILSEGSLVHAPHLAMSWFMLALLMAANAIAMHAKMVVAHERELQTLEESKKRVAREKRATARAKKVTR